MITNKDLSIDSKNGQVILNGDKYDLGTQGEIDAAVKDVYSVMGQMGAKNLIPYPYYESDHTESGITWTVNSDGSVTANGTATENSTFIFRQRAEKKKFVEKNTSYILSGCPSGGSTAKYILNFFVKKQDDSNVASGVDYGNGVTINMPDQDYYGIYAFARVISGQTVSNLTFKPMLRLASDTDDTYQPYAMTNKQLTDGQSPEAIMQIVEDNCDTTPTENSTKPATSGGLYTTIGDLTQTRITGASVAAQLGVLGAILGFTHFVQIPFTTGVLESIEAAFENGTIPVDLLGVTFGIVTGQAGSQRVIVIAQNQSAPDTTQTRYAAIYFGAYTAKPRFCQKQDGAAWTDIEL